MDDTKTFLPRFSADDIDDMSLPDEDGHSYDPGPDRRFWFRADMRPVAPMFLTEKCSNHDATRVLEGAGVIDGTCDNDTERDGFNIYFHDMLAGQAFIERLNSFLFDVEAGMTVEEMRDWTRVVKQWDRELEEAIASL